MTAAYRALLSRHTILVEVPVLSSCLTWKPDCSTPTRLKTCHCSAPHWISRSQTSQTDMPLFLVLWHTSQTMNRINFRCKIQMPICHYGVVIPLLRVPTLARPRKTRDASHAPTLVSPLSFLNGSSSFPCRVSDFLYFMPGE